MCKLIAVTDRSLCRGDFLRQVENLAKAGVDLLIFRAKELPEAEYEQLAARVLPVCRRHGVTCVLHSYPAAARRLGCTALHMPLAALRAMPEEERRQFTVLGASCHSPEDAREAEALGCTYITAGHVFATDCKKGLAPRGLDFLQAVCGSVSIPVYAIGGMAADKLAAVARAGAAGACLMSGLMTCADPAAELERLKKVRNREMKLTEQLRLYAVTDRSWVGRQTLLQQIEDALKGGVTLLQLREKELDEEAFVAEALEVKALCRRYGVPLIINDNVDVALRSGADGVHVGMEDSPVEEIRRRVGSDFIIGATAKTVEQARAAQAAGADYLGVGAVYPSPTKKNALRITPEQLREICGSVTIPAVAIGGITLENAAPLAGSGICGLAVVSAVFGAEDVRAAAEALRAQIDTML